MDVNDTDIMYKYMHRVHVDDMKLCENEVNPQYRTKSIRVRLDRKSPTCGNPRSAYPKLVQLPHPNGECTPTEMVLGISFGGLVIARVGYRTQ